MNTIATISINSECNNNCLYCFYRYKISDKKEMTFSKIKDISKWLKKSYSSVCILGGEPLLHSNFLEIVKFLSFEFESVRLITNLVTENETLINNLSKIENISYLINTTTSEKNKKLFDKNLKKLFIENNYKITDKNIPSFSFVLTGNYNLDVFSIDNVIQLFSKLPKIFHRLRIMPNMPCSLDSEKYTMKNYDAQFEYLINSIQKSIGRISLGFDCGINFCFISPFVLKKLKETNCFVCNYSICNGPYTDVTVDKKVIYCHYVSEHFFEPQNYYNLGSPNEYLEYFIKKKNDYLFKYQYLCKQYVDENKNCSKKCYGFCPALTSKILLNKIKFQ